MDFGLETRESLEPNGGLFSRNRFGDVDDRLATPSRLLDSLGGRITIQNERMLQSKPEATLRAAKSDRL
jgi:hypothetical protein